jgi:predicted metal-dependent RNase
LKITNLNPDTDIGASSWLVDLGEHRLLLDAGMHPKREGRDGLPTPSRSRTATTITSAACPSLARNSPRRTS